MRSVDALTPQNLLAASCHVRVVTVFTLPLHHLHHYCMKLTKCYKPVVCSVHLVVIVCAVAGDVLGW